MHEKTEARQVELTLICSLSRPLSLKLKE